MRKYANIGNGMYKCLRCGKEIKNFGFMGHNTWHRQQEEKKTIQQKLSIPIPLKHKPICNCGDCKIRRNNTGQ